MVVGWAFWVRRKSERKRKERERDGLASNSFEPKSLKFLRWQGVPKFAEQVFEKRGSVKQHQVVI
jgi:hypothetical protein